MAFEDRQKAEEAKYRHDQEFMFKVRNRRNKLFGLWLAETHLGRSGDEAAAYANVSERSFHRWMERGRKEVETAHVLKAIAREIIR